jgi:EAL domain-containing protein (putative c-di-GMP-specific phosphodiesterase class I)
LRRAGIRIAIDDFGTGYSSLSRLATLPIDTLKIDRSFINRLDRDARGRTLTELILNVARAYDMDVIAEGVETADQLDLLLGLGCDQAQGFLMSRPVSQDAFAALLKAGGGEFLLPPARR